jgi:hypothetical protein
MFPFLLSLKPSTVVLIKARLLSYGWEGLIPALSSINTMFLLSPFPSRVRHTIVCSLVQALKFEKSVNLLLYLVTFNLSNLI